MRPFSVGGTVQSVQVDFIKPKTVKLGYIVHTVAFW